MKQYAKGRSAAEVAVSLQYELAFGHRKVEKIDRCKFSSVSFPLVWCQFSDVTFPRARSPLNRVFSPMVPLPPTPLPFLQLITGNPGDVSLPRISHLWVIPIAPIYHLTYI